MATNVIMPQLGELVVEGTISRWLVQVGDTVEQYSPIMEVSTDKVDTEVPAPVAGVVLKLYHAEGATLQAGTVIAAIGQPGEAVADQPARVDLHAAGETAQAEPAAEAAPAKPAGRDLGRISPVVARIAQEHNVDLSQVAGSGREGRITKQDVLAYVEARSQGQAAPARRSQPRPRRSCPPGSGPAAATCSSPPTICRCPPAQPRPQRLRPLRFDQQLHPLPLAPTSNWCPTPACAS